VKRFSREAASPSRQSDFFVGLQRWPDSTDQRVAVHNKKTVSRYTLISKALPLLVAALDALMAR